MHLRCRLCIPSTLKNNYIYSPAAFYTPPLSLYSPHPPTSTCRDVSLLRQLSHVRTGRDGTDYDGYTPRVALHPGRHFRARCAPGECVCVCMRAITTIASRFRFAYSIHQKWLHACSCYHGVLLYQMVQFRRADSRIFACILLCVLSLIFAGRKAEYTHVHLCVCCRLYSQGGKPAALTGNVTVSGLTPGE